jgi:hypothetical protein
MALSKISLGQLATNLPPVDVYVFNTPTLRYYLDWQLAQSIVQNAIIAGVQKYLQSVAQNKELTARELVPSLDIPLSSANLPSPQTSQLADIAWDWNVTASGTLSAPNTLLNYTLSGKNIVWSIFGLYWLTPNPQIQWIRFKNGVYVGPWIDIQTDLQKGLLLFDSPLVLAKDDQLILESATTVTAPFTDKFAILGVVVEPFGQTATLKSP